MVCVHLLLGQVTDSPVCMMSAQISLAMTLDSVKHSYITVTVPGGPRDLLFCLIPVDPVAPGHPVVICCWSCIPLVLQVSMPLGCP